MRRPGHLFFFFLLISSLFVPGIVYAADGSISGNITDADGVAVSNATVQLLSPTGDVLKKATSSLTGDYVLSPVAFGSYQITIEGSGFDALKIPATVAATDTTRIDGHLVAAGSQPKEFVVNVKAKRNLVHTTGASSKSEITKEQIKTLPGGEDISLPKLLASTTPGVIQGSFGQMFIRGNHGNIQYQIDGVQLPDSMSGTFGDAFSPRSIDHMDIITGGMNAEYGERLAAVMNIVTKSGPETPTGTAEMSYGSYNTINPQASYGGSDSSGRLRYFVTANYMQTDRGLDTPQPASYADQAHGGSDAIHDKANSNDEFARIDYILNDENKFTVNLYNSSRYYQIPNFPSQFQSGDAYFGPTYTDPFGNVGANTWTPSNTDNTQKERNSYIELVWKKTLSESSFLQIAPYYKRSALSFSSDAANDLPPAGNQQGAFNMNRSVDNYGIKTDYSTRLNEFHLIKAGFLAQQSNSGGSFSLQTAINTPPTNYGTPDRGGTEAVYVQDTYAISKPLTLDAGLRYTATQFNTTNLTTQDGLLQPRIGLSYLLTETTKVHVFYGKLFQPAPFEDLRDAFATNGGSAAPYDIKAEQDDYYEAGIAQQVNDSHLVSLNYYYKYATNMIDDTQLLGTSIAQPYNFAHGFATGLELSVNGTFASHWSDFFNYSYEDARGQGISGGAFTQPVNTDVNAPYQFLDHVQLNTANAGLTYKADAYWATVQGLYGSGLRTRSDNGGSLPSHTTFDFTVGYTFHDQDWWSKWRVSADVTNIFDVSYPVTIANGYNGNHYAAGRQFFIRLAKEL